MKGLRVRRMVSCDTLIDRCLDEMCGKFIARGYPRASLMDFKRRPLDKSRDDLLRPKELVMEIKRAPFVTSYNGLSKRISGEHWPLLIKDQGNIEEFKMPPLFSYRRNINLKDELVKSDVGSSKRDLQSTLSCLSLVITLVLAVLVAGNHFFHPPSEKRYNICKRYTCTRSYVIYVISCHCGLLYVGETTMEVKARISKHRSTIRMALIDLPVLRHFKEKGHLVTQLQFRVINDVPVLRRGEIGLHN
ncbi:unnamed protein product [Ranitomeya imitator]|uniref:GIY-YIG domain-containing protein n=1 Tax=Ranitomeya imitator TaxID=111125 RepID=A0ABN9L474_9NEOB|nr:unnamed protein product [Ranitomeya imitator]